MTSRTHTPINPDATTSCDQNSLRSGRPPHLIGYLCFHRVICLYPVWRFGRLSRRRGRCVLTVDRRVLVNLISRPVLVRAGSLLLCERRTVPLLRGPSP